MSDERYFQRTKKTRETRLGGARRALSMVIIGVAWALGATGCGGEISGTDEATDLDVGTTRSALGSSEQVQTITTLAQLRAMTVTGNYRLGNSINASATGQPGQQFVPIGSPFNPFRGTFDGANNTISNLRINTNGGWYTGMFSGVSNAIIRRVGLTNVNVSGGSFTGAIAGIIDNSQVTSSYVTGTVRGPTSGGPAQAVGMAIGSALSSAVVNRCYATGTVTGRSTTIGGFVGEIVGGLDSATRARFTEIFTNVNVDPDLPSGSTYEVLAGGLVGRVSGGWIENINSHGNVTGRGAAGGIIGELTETLGLGTLFENCVSNGIVTDATTPLRAGTYGRYIGDNAIERCGSLWNSTTDSGTPQQPGCHSGKSRTTLRAPHPAPNLLVDPFHKGMLITANMVPPFESWQIGLGSDGDWGFGIIPGQTQVWALNSSSEYITLTRIPNPSVQPR